jgi:DNA topoisomerase-2
MTEVKRPLRNFLNEDFRDYSLYTLHNRAITDLLGGLKPVHRKIMWTAQRKAKSFIKVIGLTGYVLAESNYHHGDMSVSEAIVKLAAPWSNHVPILDHDGYFGWRLEPKAAAPRYIMVRLSQNFLTWFSDFNALSFTPQDDGECYEPDQYFCNVPWNLVNGCTGIATGYASTIHPRNPHKIAKLIHELLCGRTPEPGLLDIEYPSSTAKIEGFDSIGSVKHVQRNIYDVTELPPLYTQEVYKNKLETLLAKGVISNYEVTMSDNNPPFRVWLKEQPKDIEDALKLRTKLPAETFVFIHDNAVITFDDVWDYIGKFIEERLKISDASVRNHISSREKTLENLESKILFIDDMIRSGIQGLTRDILNQRIGKFTQNPELHQQLTRIAITNFTQEKIKELIEEIKELHSQIKSYQQLTPENHWKSQIVGLLA